LFGVSDRIQPRNLLQNVEFLPRDRVASEQRRIRYESLPCVFTSVSFPSFVLYHYLGFRIGEHEQVLRAKLERLRQPLDQRHRRPPAAMLDISDVAALDSDRLSKITLGHSSCVTGLLDDRTERSFCHGFTPEDGANLIAVLLTIRQQPSNDQPGAEIGLYVMFFERRLGVL
jgi:hypothetical protein